MTLINTHEILKCTQSIQSQYIKW